MTMPQAAGKKYDQFTKLKYILETSCKRSLSSVDHPESNNNRNAKKLRKSSHCHITETGKLDWWAITAGKYSLHIYTQLMQLAFDA